MNRDLRIVDGKIGHATVTSSKRAVIREGAAVSKPRRADKPGATVTIVLPLPHKGLSPNARLHHHQKATLTKKHRETAYFETRAAMRAKRITGGWQRAEASEVYYWPTAARRDVRNAEGSLKAAWDGIVDSGLILDDDVKHLTHLPSRFDVDKANPRVEITVRNLGGVT